MIDIGWEWAMLLPAAFIAGLVDAVVGGGGLIQVPALLSALPAEAPATVFGTNKASSIFGTASAAKRYVQRIAIPWNVVLPLAAAAFAFSFAGAAAVAWLPRDIARPLIFALLVAVALYTAFHRDLGVISGAAARPRLGRALAAGAGLGFYDGFLGPGMGSFLIFAFVRWFDLDFLRASAAAKIVNGCTNLAALAFFIPSGHVLLGLALPMAVCNVGGAHLGTRLAIRHGSTFVRGAFFVATVVMIAKFGIDIIWRG